MNPELRKESLRRMLRIRRIEEAIVKRYPEKKMRCPVHLSIGQEAIAVGVSAHLTSDDHVYSNHRCHAHFLAKGGNLNAMIAELHGKATGVAGGKGGSMHLIDLEVGMMGASALVGGTIPLAVGSALAFSRERKKNVAVVFMGDGATEEGIFYESINFAQLKKLPVIFVCENNLYATYSHQKNRQAETDIAKRVSGFGIHTQSGDGNDITTIHEKIAEGIRLAFDGSGPSFFEFSTYRWLDHVGITSDEHVGYRTREEIEEWKSRCPIARELKWLHHFSPNATGEIEQWEETIETEIETAFAFADSSPYPSASEIHKDVYAPASL